MEFDDPKEFPPLHDGQKDEDRLKEVFTTLGFTVILHQNLKKIEMTKKLKECTTWKHFGRALFVIILSHGGEGDVVFGTDGGEVKLHKLQEFFSAASCPSLENAPKLFLFDACRGANTEIGDPNVKPGKIGGTSKVNPVTTNSLHFATVFASTRGNAAFMLPQNSQKKGSYFTQTLIEVIKEADESKEFNEIITEVRYRILQEAQAQKQKVKVQNLEQEVKIKGPEQEVKVKGPEQEVKAKCPEQEVKAQDPEQEVKAQDPEQEVKAKGPEQEVKPQELEQEEEVKAKYQQQQKEMKQPEGIMTQTVQYTSTLLKLYYIKKK